MSVDQRISGAIDMLVYYANVGNRNLQMPGDGRYQPQDLKPFLGYDQWAGWLVIIEWAWMLTLADQGEMPAKDAKLLTEKRLEQIIKFVTTTKQDELEKQTRHDILALRKLMTEHMPKSLQRWLHYGATSYDVIDTAYALQLKTVFDRVFWPKLLEIDRAWSSQIAANANIVQAGRTHLQTALPLTVGFWLAQLRGRFLNVAIELKICSDVLEGKFSGAVGTYAAQAALMPKTVLPLGTKLENSLMEKLDLAKADLSTQIVPPESRSRFYFGAVLLSGVLANLGEDVRILQSSQFGELRSASSTSSAMPHKTGNPIAAEQLAGMHESVKAEFGKVMGTLVSDLQRDLRNSSVARSYSAVLVYTYQQLLTTSRLLKSLEVDKERCQKNFDEHKKLVVAELLHLSLQKAGLMNSHDFVHKVVMPELVAKLRELPQTNMVRVMEFCLISCGKDSPEAKAWRKVDKEVKEVLANPEKYIGIAAQAAITNSKDGLE